MMYMRGPFRELRPKRPVLNWIYNTSEIKASMKHIQKYELFEELLNEVGDSSSKPYPSDFYGDYGSARIYGFETPNYAYTVELQYTDIDDYEGAKNVLAVRFYVPDDKDPDIERDDIVTNKGELFKVMASVVNVIKKDLSSHPEVDTLLFTPAKKEGETTNIARLNLYSKYIKNELPMAVISKGPKKSIKVKLNNK
jgi:hypothetical protein